MGMAEAGSGGQGHSWLHSRFKANLGNSMTLCLYGKQNSAYGMNLGPARSINCLQTKLPT